MAERGLSWLLLLFIPLSVYVVLDLNGVAQNASIFSAICSGSLTLWLFSRVPDFLPAMLALLMLLLFDLAPENITLSGFSSPMFILALSLMGIGITVVQSGLVQRTGAFLLRLLPQNSFYQQWAVLIVGFLYQSFTFNDKKPEKIVLPMLTSIAETWDDVGRQKNALMLTTTSQDAVHYFSPVLLSAAPANLIVLAFLSNQNQSIFTFSFWFYACSVTALLMLALYLLATFWYLKPLRKINLSEKSTSECFQSPGPLNSMEKLALMAIVILLGGIATQSLHQQPLSHLCLGVLSILVVMSGRHWKNYVSKIKWDFLLLLASVAGIFSVMKYLQLDLSMANRLAWLSQFIAQQFALSIMLLAILIVIARKLMSAQVVTLIFGFIFLPLSVHAGINPWLFGLIILLFASTRRFEEHPKNCFWDVNTIEGLPIDFTRLNQFQNILWLVRLTAIYLSIPFWQITGLL